MIKYRENKPYVNRTIMLIYMQYRWTRKGLEGKMKGKKNMPDLHAIKKLNGQFCTFFTFDFTFQEVHLFRKAMFLRENP